MGRKKEAMLEHDFLVEPCKTVVVTENNHQLARAKTVIFLFNKLSMQHNLKHDLFVNPTLKNLGPQIFLICYNYFIKTEGAFQFDGRT